MARFVSFMRHVAAWMKGREPGSTDATNCSLPINTLQPTEVGCTEPRRLLPVERGAPRGARPCRDMVCRTESRRMPRKGSCWAGPSVFLGLTTRPKRVRDGLRDEQRAVGRLAGAVGEQRVVQVAVAAVDACLLHGEGGYGQQLCADARRRAEPERHAGELVELVVEAEDEVGQRGRVQREGEEAVGQVQLAEPVAWPGLLHGLNDGGVREVFVAEVVVEVAGQGR